MVNIQVPPEFITAASHACGAVLFLTLTILLLTAWRGRLQGGLLVGACIVSTFWCAAVATSALLDYPTFVGLLLLELARSALWFLFLLGLLGYSASGRGRSSASLGYIPVGVFGLCTIVGLVVLSQLAPQALPLAPEDKAKAIHFGYLVLAVMGLILVEQVYRNTRAEHRWAIKFLCFGLGAIFVFDLYLYSNALLFGRIDSILWSARGVISALAVPLVAVAAVRNPAWSVEIFVSRHVVFHTASLLGSGVYLILMAAAGYYIRYYGGTWGGVAQTVFLSGALMLLLVLMSSGQLRARLRVLLGKHFYSNKYDYREEWLKFTHTLSSREPGAELKTTVIRATAAIVESPGGIMWSRDRAGPFRVVASWQAAPPSESTISSSAPLIQFLERQGWVIAIDEYLLEPDRYPGLALPKSVESLRRPWLIVPLMQADELVGLIALQHSGTKVGLNWEDHDLLKTVGRQAASYVALVEANEALNDARQFEAFNRLSAYVVHDLKNLVAQLSLVVDNSKRHLHSPGFVEDAIGTVEHASNKMNRLLGQLRKGRTQSRAAERIVLNEVLADVVKSRRAQEPVPVLHCTQKKLAVFLERDRLESVIEHLVQNAQEATPATGEVSVTLTEEGLQAVIAVKDNGAGMDAKFVAERLFRPFDTTKGNAGMGVGVYESREFVVAAGGAFDVSSETGRGTTFYIRLPIDVSSGSERPSRDDVGALS